MSKDANRIEFYEKLEKCKTRTDIEGLIDIIDNDELYAIMIDKYNQILEFNKKAVDSELVKDIIKILQYTYLEFEKNSR